MFVRRFYDDRLAQASYLVGCQRTGQAIVFDPARDIAPYLDTAKREKFTISKVTETHIHADFVSGTRELAAATEAEVLLSAEGGKDWQYGYAAADRASLLHDGDVITLGGVRITVMHTPGHTPEHLVFIVTDTIRSDEPLAMISGDFLFVGDVGRPDLLEVAAGITNTKEAGARDLYHSLQRLGPLPDHLQIWPGHGAGSACGKALGAVPTSTLGYERRTNWAFQVKDEAAFVTAVLEGQPAPPTYFARMKRVNRDGPAVLGRRPAPPQLPGEALDPALAKGVVVDLRPRRQYAAAHVPGTLNIPLINAFTTWSGWLLPYDRDLYLIAPDADAVADAMRALASIDLDRVKGVFGTEVIAEAETAGRARTTSQATMADAAILQQRGTVIIDLREADEWRAGHLDGAVHHPLGTLEKSVAALPRSTPVALHCGGGTRSAIGASLLEQMGFADVIDLTDGWSGVVG
jgi:hydroxyacylglutathione hydrolase